MGDRANDRGTGLIGTIGGTFIVLSFLLFAVQLLVGLYARTTVTAIATDAAQRAVSGNALRTPEALALYASDAERALSGVDGEVDFDESLNLDDDPEPEVIVVHVRATAPRFIPPFLGGDLGVRSIERRIRMDVEEFQEP